MERIGITVDLEVFTALKEIILMQYPDMDLSEVHTIEMNYGGI